MKIRLTPSESAMLISSTGQLYQILKRILQYEGKISSQREHLWVIGFKSLNYIEFIELVAYGANNAVNAVPREVFRMAVSKGCNRIVLAHNHPAGSLKPSVSDLEVSKRLLEGGAILGIKVIDHLIITDRGHRSIFYHANKGPLNLPKNFDPFEG